MRLTIELDANEMKTYADTVCAFVGTVAGNRAVSVPMTTQTAAAVVQPAPVIQTQQPDPEDNAPVDSNAPNVDATGMPWDERIHSPNKTRIANGQWRKKKGVDEAMVAAVEAERRGAVQQQPATQAQPVTMPGNTPQLTAADASAALFGQFAQATPAGMQQQPGTDQFAQFAQAQQQQPVQPNNPTVMVSQPGMHAIPQTFQDFMKIVAGGVNIGKIDPNYIMSLCQRCGIQAISDLSTNPALIPTAYGMLVADGRV